MNPLFGACERGLRRVWKFELTHRRGAAYAEDPQSKNFFEFTLRNSAYSASNKTVAGREHPHPNPLPQAGEGAGPCSVFRLRKEAPHYSLSRLRESNCV